MTHPQLVIILNDGHIEHIIGSEHMDVICLSNDPDDMAAEAERGAHDACFTPDNESPDYISDAQVYRRMDRQFNTFPDICTFYFETINDETYRQSFAASVIQYLDNAA